MLTVLLLSCPSRHVKNEFNCYAAFTRISDPYECFYAVPHEGYVCCPVCRTHAISCLLDKGLLGGFLFLFPCIVLGICGVSNEAFQCCCGTQCSCIEGLVFVQLCLLNDGIGCPHLLLVRELFTSKVAGLGRIVVEACLGKRVNIHVDR